MKRAQRGLSNSVQVSVLLPLTLGIFLGLLQWSLNAWGEATALAAAQAASASAAALGATEADGVTAAADVHRNGALSAVSVDVRRGTTTTTATVTGRPTLVLWPSSITRTVTVPTERLTAP